MIVGVLVQFFEVSCVVVVPLSGSLQWRETSIRFVRVIKEVLLVFYVNVGVLIFAFLQL